MNLLTIEHTALIFNTEPYIISKLLNKGLIRGVVIGDLERVSEIEPQDLYEYEVLIKSEEVLS